MVIETVLSNNNWPICTETCVKLITLQSLTITILMKIYSKDKLSYMAYDCLSEPLFSLVYACVMFYTYCKTSQTYIL